MCTILNTDLKREAASDCKAWDSAACVFPDNSTVRGQRLHNKSTKCLLNSSRWMLHPEEDLFVSPSFDMLWNNTDQLQARCSLRVYIKRLHAAHWTKRAIYKRCAILYLQAYSAIDFGYINNTDKEKALSLCFLDKFQSILWALSPAATPLNLTKPTT